MNCPKDEYPLEFISGDFPTGVVAPDGYRETRYQEGLRCPQCRTIYDESELDELIGEGRDPEFVIPT